VKECLIALWSDFWQVIIDFGVDHWIRRLQACVRANGGHFEHRLWTNSCKWFAFFMCFWFKWLLSIVSELKKIIVVFYCSISLCFHYIVSFILLYCNFHLSFNHFIFTLLCVLYVLFYCTNPAFGCYTSITFFFWCLMVDRPTVLNCKALSLLRTVNEQKVKCWYFAWC